MKEKPRTFDPRKFERDMQAIRCIKSSHLPDNAVNDLIRLQIGRRHPTNYGIAVTNAILKEAGLYS